MFRRVQGAFIPPWSTSIAMRNLLHRHGKAWLERFPDLRLRQIECSTCHQESVIIDTRGLDETITCDVRWRIGRSAKRHTVRILGADDHQGISITSLSSTSERSGITKRMQRLGFQFASTPNCAIRPGPDGSALYIRPQTLSKFCKSPLVLIPIAQEQ